MNALGNQPSWFYFTNPSNLACHDLTTTATPPPNFRHLLGLGLTYCTRPKYTLNQYTIQPSLDRFTRDLYVKCYFAPPPQDADEPKLADEFDPKLHIKSDWKPPTDAIPIELRARCNLFLKQMKQKCRPRRTASNLIRSQQKILAKLNESNQLIVMKSDKNLGPAITERSTYIRRVSDDHLLDTDTYRWITENQAYKRMNRAKTQIDKFLKKYKTVIPTKEQKYIRTSLDVPDAHFFPQFYVTAKVHKTPWKTRPVVSVSGSVLHGFGIWLDRQLQSYGRATDAYIQSSWELVQQFQTLPTFPPTAKLLTMDAISMYTNIDIRHGVEATKGILPAHLITAIKIVMLYNVFQFSDTYWHQLNGTAMGHPPSCMWATLYYSAHEEYLMKKYAAYLLYYRRYIDDVIMVWDFDGTPAADRWYKEFLQETSFGLLRWEATEPTDTVIFLDVSVTLHQGRLSNRLYEKALNLYLYLPPSSAHPPGVLAGLITGMILRILRLNSDPTHRQEYIQSFYNRLIARGYKKNNILPLFEKSIRRFQSTLESTRPEADYSDTLFFHLTFNPFNMKSRDIQDMFKKYLLDHRWQDPAATPLPEIQNHKHHPIRVNRLIVAYH